MAKETSEYGKREYGKREYGKRDLRIWQKRPRKKAKET